MRIPNFGSISRVLVDPIAGQRNPVPPLAGHRTHPRRVADPARRARAGGSMGERYRPHRGYPPRGLTLGPDEGDEPIGAPLGFGTLMASELLVRPASSVRVTV